MYRAKDEHDSCPHRLSQTHKAPSQRSAPEPKARPRRGASAQAQHRAEVAGRTQTVSERKRPERQGEALRPFNGESGSRVQLRIPNVGVVGAQRASERWGFGAAVAVAADAAVADPEDAARRGLAGLARPAEPDECAVSKPSALCTVA